MGNNAKKSNSESFDYCGTVQWFQDNLGYGFIESPSFTKPIFAHHSRIINDEKWKTLAKGQLVDFQVSETVKGLMAVNIREKRIVKATGTLVEPKIEEVINNQ